MDKNIIEREKLLNQHEKKQEHIQSVNTASAIVSIHSFYLVLIANFPFSKIIIPTFTLVVLQWLGNEVVQRWWDIRRAHASVI